MATMQDVIRTITLRGNSEGITQATNDLKGLAAAEETVSKSTVSMASKLDALQKSLDAEYRAEEKLASIEKTLAAARSQGLISIERQNALLTLAAQKYRVVGEAALATKEQIATAKEIGMGLISGLGAGAAFAGLAELPMKIMETVHEAAGLAHVAETIGITTDKLQELQYAGAQFHVSAETMDAALEKFSKNLGMASTGGGELAKILKANHVVITGDLTKDLENYANLIKNATNEEQRNLLVTTAFGKNAAEMGLLFSEGAAGIRDATKAAEENGAVLSGDQLKAAQELDSEFVKMQQQISATFKDFAITIAPLVIAALQGITAEARDLKKTLDDIKTLNLAGVAVDVGVQALKLVPGSNADLVGAQIRQQFPQLFGGTPIKINGGREANAVNTGDHAKATVLPSTQSSPSAYDAVTAALKRQIAALTESNRQAYIDQQLASAKVTSASKEGHAIEGLAAKYYDQKKAIDATNQAATFLGQTIFDAFTGMIDGSQDVVSSMANIAKAIGMAVVQAEMLGSGPLAGILGTQSTGNGAGGLLGTLFSGLLGGITGGATGGAWGKGLWGSAIFNANGGIYSGAGISAYSGSIVSQPTVFPFARGVGLMGEAGPEAILPLRRGSDGKLGIAANQNSGVTVNFHNVGKDDIPDLDEWARTRLPGLIGKANRHKARATI